MTAAAATAPRHPSILSVLLVALLLLGVAAPGPVHPGPSREDAKPLLVAQQSSHFVAAQPIPEATPPEQEKQRPATTSTTTAGKSTTAEQRSGPKAPARAPPTP
ncbi:hypothetical protein AB0F91_27485 [Amycolatopsis sp. NPDC023774]|uniref:hypothetical protein n=1 Tax=Amycolatopsis sp. NPDC023774 TaxID=3155015 RepID=UPI0033CAA8D6